MANFIVNFTVRAVPSEAHFKMAYDLSCFKHRNDTEDMVESFYDLKWEDRDAITDVVHGTLKVQGATDEEDAIECYRFWAKRKFKRLGYQNAADSTLETHFVDTYEQTVYNEIGYEMDTLKV